MKRLFALLLALMLLLCACGGDSQESESRETIDESLYTEVERDENGNVIRTVETTDEGTKEVFYKADGTVEKEVLVSNDGTRSERTFAGEGYVSLVVTITTEGTRIESYSRDAASLEKEVWTEPDGSVITHYYNEKNVRTHSEATYADGEQVHTTYHPSCGKHIQTTHRTDGSIDETEFDEEGNAIRSVLTEADGTITQWTYEYHEGGEVKVESILHNDGTVVELHFRTDGTAEKRVVIENGVRKEYPCDEEGNELPPEEDNGSGNSGSKPQGTLTGSVTQEGDYTVVVLGKDNWKDYLEEYTDVLFVEGQDRVIVRKYFVVKNSVGQVDKDRSHVELEYIAQSHEYQCSVDPATKTLTVGQLIRTGEIIHSPSELDQFRIFADVYCDSRLVGYGLSCSACEVSSASTVICDTVIIDMEWIEGTLYLK